LIIGADGQVGNSLHALLRALPHSTLTPEDEDLSQSASGIIPHLDRLKPTAIINAAAYTNVDGAESATEINQTLNTELPRLLAEWSSDHGTPLVHYSTDYVYPGDGERPWREEDSTLPVNAYGAAKLAGDQAIADISSKFLIFRTSWVFSPFGKNFVKTMLSLGKERDELKIIDDQIGAPTLAEDLAKASLDALAQAVKSEGFPSGVYHCCNGGETNWYLFATKIFELARSMGWSGAIERIRPIPTSEFPTPARRPKNSRMSLDKLTQTFGIEMPTWSQGLKVCLEELLKE
jgi:dTDP-4-dehydrorhamnose reductase